jgi:hypothetical protein
MKPRALLALTALAACGGSQSPRLVPEARSESCAGNAFVSVINDWNRPVEIYAYAANSVTGTQIGTVQPGTSIEFALPRDAVGAAATTAGLTDPVPLPSRARPLVRLRYLCR